MRKLPHTAAEELYESSARDHGWMKKFEPAPSSYLARRMLFGDLVLLFVVLRDVWAHFDLWGQSEVALEIHPGDAVMWYTDPTEGGGGELFTEPLELRWQLALHDLMTPGYVERLIAEAFEEVSAAFGLLLPKVATEDGALVVKALGNVSPEWFRTHGLRCV